MSLSLTRLAWSMWGGRGKEKKPVSSKASALDSKQSSEWGLAKETKMAPPHMKVGRNKEERRVDREYDDDVVLVPSDDDCNSDWCLSGSESDDSDWSIGWLEPLASDFRAMVMMVLQCWFLAINLAAARWWRRPQTRRFWVSSRTSPMNFLLLGRITWNNGWLLFRILKRRKKTTPSYGPF